VASYERKQEVLREENKSLRQTILVIRRSIAQAIPDSKVPTAHHLTSEITRRGKREA
jgi:hypothetical protein